MKTFQSSINKIIFTAMILDLGEITISYVQTGASKGVDKPILNLVDIRFKVR